MKKIIALVMAMLLAFSCAAFATEAAEEIVLEVSYEGAWVEMDYGLGLFVPTDWFIAELTEDQMNAGIFAFFTNEDMTETLQISIAALADPSITLESQVEALAEVYDGVALYELPNCNMLTYADYERGVFCGMTIDSENGLLYTLNFMPYSEEFAALASEIICTFGYIAYEE